ncbi:MAG: HAD-IIA family hydrolase [Pseudonocardiaceae bacterium]
MRRNAPSSSAGRSPVTALSGEYDGVLLDLDGTVFRGRAVVPAAPDAIARVRRTGTGLAFVTNNAARSPEQVAEHLVSAGIDVATDDVVTSAQAGADVLAARLDAGSAVLVVGTEALAAEVSRVGLRPVRAAEDDPAAVVQGHSTATGWAELAEACLAIRAGSLWVACNVDATLPTERGNVPGNGAMVAALRAATNAEPVVAGKPHRPLVDAAIARLGASRPLLVGDRLDTDIAGAGGAGLDSLLVLSGVSDAAAVLAAPQESRPTFLAGDVAALGEDTGAARIGERPGWSCEVTGGTLVLHCTGSASVDPLDALRALCSHWWATRGGPTPVTGGDAAATDALRALGLGDGPGGRAAAQPPVIG